MGLIREAQWTNGGHRLYDESVFARLSKIMELRKTKTLWEIRRILTSQEQAAEAPQKTNDRAAPHDWGTESKQTDL